MRRHRRGHEHNETGEPEGSGVHGPYWLRAHKDWRFLVGLLLMLVAIVTYVMSGDLGWVWRWAR